jgi:hypothetical protein
LAPPLLLLLLLQTTISTFVTVPRSSVAAK